ncbi:WD40 repeat domain-containing serine/threonine protein kinase [Candidatus Uabimicrobium amorphum]|uniref:Serine/threonine-protein kinase PknB n=1 Tax=Uabimicrobium amorphum TaxID=2596890 RepID=A0A5S9ILI3_UABAM|nr:serine/threonine-protein kinase [Candidatus Uabimicrobium amorphum]BBM83751.1 serine/threonine-protein kinase PknB [Candidatus Uabimicrobium amorphum]
MNSKQQLISRIIFQQKWMSEAQIRSAYANFCTANLSISFLDFLEEKQLILPAQKASIVKIITASLHQTQRTNFTVRENQRFLQYHVEKEIGHGGMGIVYKARDLKLQRDVAIKVLSNTNRDSVKRLIQEARTIARLNHPYVIKIYDVGETRVSYFAMEYIDGQTLEEYIHSQKMSFDKWAVFFHKVTQAVDFIHQNEIIHRDIKPANIMIDQHGEPRLMDFGLAKTYEDKSLPCGFVGTPSYASPEQIESNSVTYHSDIYSLGATLYEALTKAQIFQGEMVHLVYQIVKSDPIRPKVLNPSIPLDLQAICLKCVAKKPLHRYKTAADLATDLNNFIHNRPVMAKSPSYFDIAKKWIARNMLLSCFIFLFLASIHIALAIFISANNNLSKAYEELQQQQTQTEEQKYKMQLQLYHASLEKMEQFIQQNSFVHFRKTLNQYSQKNFLLNTSQNYLLLSKKINPAQKLETRLLSNLYSKPKNLVPYSFHFSNFSVNNSNTFLATNYGKDLQIVHIESGSQKKYSLEERISCSVFHPYEHQLFVAGEHGAVFKVDLTTEKITRFAIDPQPNAWVTFCHFSNDGSQVVYCIVNRQGESTFVFIDWQTHKYTVVHPQLTVRTNEGSTMNMEQVLNIAYTPNKRVLLLTGRRDEGLGIFYLAKNMAVKLLETPTIITDFAAYNNYIITSHTDGQLIIGKINDRRQKIVYRQITKWQAHQDSIYSVSATKDYIISCSKDKTIKIWDYNGKLHHTFPDSHFKRAHFIPKNNQLITINFSQHIQLWSLQRKSPIVLPTGKQWANLAISPQSNYLALTMKTAVSLVQIWDLQTHKPVKIFPENLFNINFRQMNSVFLNDTQLLTRGHKVVRYWNIDKANEMGQILQYPNQNYTHIQRVQTMTCGKDGILTADVRKLCLWNKQSKQLEREWKSTFGEISFADFYDKDTLILGSHTNLSLQLEFINRHNDQVHKTPLMMYTEEQAVTFNYPIKQHKILSLNNKRYLFFISPGRSVIYMFTCDPTRKEQTLSAVFVGHSGNINNIQFMHDNSRMVSAGNDHTIKIWDLENIKKYPVENECLLSIEEHTAPVTGIVFNKDYSQLISASEDKTIRIWSLKR